MLSCLAALGDGAATAVTGGGGRGVAACAVPALALAFALWSAWFTCRGYRHSFLAAYHAKDAYAVTSEVIPGRKGRYLIKSRRTVAGFIRRAEEPSAGESLCAAAAPFLAGGTLVLSLGVSLGSGDPGSLFPYLCSDRRAERVVPLAVFLCLAVCQDGPPFDDERLGHCRLVRGAGHRHEPPADPHRHRCLPRRVPGDHQHPYPGKGGFR